MSYINNDMMPTQMMNEYSKSDKWSQESSGKWSEVAVFI